MCNRLGAEETSDCCRTLVARIVMEANRARGVEIFKNGLRETIWAEREIILCGGTVKSPPLSNALRYRARFRFEAHLADFINTHNHARRLKDKGSRLTNTSAKAGLPNQNDSNSIRSRKCGTKHLET
jgi:hypothetical protein